MGKSRIEAIDEASLLLAFGLILSLLLATSIYGVVKFNHNEIKIPCPQIDGTISGIKQLKYTDATLFHFDIKKNSRIIGKYSILVRPSVKKYKKGDHIILHEKCYEFYGLRSAGYTFEEQHYKKRLNKHKRNMSIAGIVISGFFLFYWFALLGQYVE